MRLPGVLYVERGGRGATPSHSACSLHVLGRLGPTPKVPPPRLDAREWLLRLNAASLRNPRGWGVVVIARRSTRDTEAGAWVRGWHAADSVVCEGETRPLMVRN